MKFVIAKRWWDIQDCLEHPDYLFVFGDNDIHQGHGGQAIIRDQPNAIGIPTKKLPSNNPDSFYNDGELNNNIKRLNFALNQVIHRSTSYRKVVFPKDGLGTGLSQLPIKAPKTYQYLCFQLNNLFGLKY